MKFTQEGFSGGLDLFTERTRLEPNKYPLLVNGRSRFGKVTPTKSPVELQSGLPSGIKQGLYAAGSFAIVFANGHAFIRDYSSASSSFSLLPDFLMSTQADQLYLELVPASTINYARQLSDVNVNSSVTLLSRLIAPSPVAAVVQDGVSQPWVILSDGRARRTSDYNQWSNTESGREYVPIGKQMVYVDSKLYITDGKQIFQSVSGRPLDFMVVVDAEGNKLSSILEGGASNVSHKTFYDDITCLGKLSSDNGSFFAGSPRNSVLVSPDFENTIYGEPRFRNIYLSNSGPLNQQSFVGDVNGDSAFVDNNGIKSFNSILQFKNEGRNAPLSLLIRPLFGSDPNQPIQQTVTATGQFDNYTCYAIQSIYGNIIVWFDELRQAWDAIDIYSDLADDAVKQFAQVLTPQGVTKLLCLTVSGRVFELFAGEVEGCKLYIGDRSSNDGTVDLDSPCLNLVFSNVTESGMVNATLYVDGKKQNLTPIIRTVEDHNGNVSSPPESLPFGDSSTYSTSKVVVDFQRKATGFRFGLWIEWDFNGTLTHVDGEAAEVTAQNSTRQQCIDYAVNKNALNALTR